MLKHRNFAVRMALEEKELRKRKDRLIDFVGSPASSSLTLVDRMLLYAQLTGMIIYHGALRRRLDRAFWRDDR